MIDPLPSSLGSLNPYFTRRYKSGHCWSPLQDRFSHSWTCTCPGYSCSALATSLVEAWAQGPWMSGFEHSSPRGWSPQPRMAERRACPAQLTDLTDCNSLGFLASGGGAHTLVDMNRTCSQRSWPCRRARESAGRGQVAGDQRIGVEILSAGTTGFKRILKSSYMGLLVTSKYLGIFSAQNRT